AAAALAHRLAAGPTLAYAEAKHAIAKAATSSIENVLGEEAAAQQRLAQTKDHQNAVTAFLAKDKPTFTGE
ncbi:MAG: enoyl-CoA hydratase, partial [Sciscionella sp.]